MSSLFCIEGSVAKLRNTALFTVVGFSHILDHVLDHVIQPRKLILQCQHKHLTYYAPNDVSITCIARAVGSGTAGTAMAVLVFEQVPIAHVQRIEIL